MGAKVFGIGFHKTGTTTLARCLEWLGYNVCPEALGYPLCHDVATHRYETALELAKGFNGFEDSPWCYRGFYQILDAAFPSAKFILTSRDPETWFTSILRWAKFQHSTRSIHVRWTVGVVLSAKSAARAKRGLRSHSRQVREYFAGRPNKLLVVDWAAGDGWAELCAFLGKPIPQRVAFPHALRYDPKTRTYIP